MGDGSVAGMMVRLDSVLIDRSVRSLRKGWKVVLDGGLTEYLGRKSYSNG